MADDVRELIEALLEKLTGNIAAGLYDFSYEDADRLATGIRAALEENASLRSRLEAAEKDSERLSMLIEREATVYRADRGGFFVEWQLPGEDGPVKDGPTREDPRQAIDAAREDTHD